MDEETFVMKGLRKNMTRILWNDEIYDGTTAQVVDVVGAEQCKIQGVGSGSYTLKGRLSTTASFDTICTIKVSDFSKKSEITDTAVYSADVSGYSQVTVEASGLDSITAVLIG